MSATNAIDKALVKRIVTDSGDPNCGFMKDTYDQTSKTTLDIVGSAVFVNPHFILKANPQQDVTNLTPRLTYYSEDRDVKQDKGILDFYLDIIHQDQDFVDEISERMEFLLTDPYKQRATTAKIIPDGAIIGVIKLIEEADAQSPVGKLFLKRLKFEIRFARK